MGQTYHSELVMITRQTAKKTVKRTDRDKVKHYYEQKQPASYNPVLAVTALYLQ